MINKFLREDLQSFKNYEVIEKSYDVKIDANESFINVPREIKEEIAEFVMNMDFNLYPDSFNTSVCEAYSNYVGIDKDKIIAGNGSDELIQILITAFSNKGDKILTCEPDFSMYRVYSTIAAADNIVFKLDSDFNLDIENFIKVAKEEEPKVILLSNPNNPTGKIIKREDIIKIIEESPSIVVIDEAYYEFYGESVIDLIDKYENLIVLRTCSKAIGLASLRIGFLLTNKKLLNEISKIKPPFNVNTFTQGAATIILNKKHYINGNIKRIIEERNYLYKELKKNYGLNVIESYANFIMVKADKVNEIYDKLIKNSIVVRKFDGEPLKNHLRITVGNREENELVIKALKEINI